MRPPLVFVPVVTVGCGAKFNLPPGKPPDALGTVVAIAPTQQFGKAVDNAGELRRLSSQDQYLLMAGERLATGQMAGAPVSKASSSESSSGVR